MILYLIMIFTIFFLAIFLFLYIFYEYSEYYQTEEFQEFKLFKSEYKKYTDKKEKLIKKIRKKKRKIQELTDPHKLLEKELESRSIRELIAAPDIGEGTVTNLYVHGYKTLKDIDSFSFRESSMPEYIGPIRYNSIKNWYNKEKHRRKKQIPEEIKIGKFFNKKIGIELEKTKKYKINLQEKLNNLEKVISSFDSDLERYKKISFFNFLKKNTEILYKNIIDPKLIETKYSSKEVFGIPKISCIAKTDERAIEQFNKEFLLLKKKYPQSYRNMLFLDLSSRKIHPFIIHKGGISFSSEKRIVTIFFKEIKCCSKIGNTILLSIKNGTKIGFYLIEDSEVAYNYIKTFVTSVVKLQKND